jgi:protein-disulfide isomerase
MKSSDNKNLIPAAIILAGLVLSFTIYSVRFEKTPDPVEGDLTLMTPVGIQDHLIGNPDATVTLITYTDIDCEFCKRFQEAMEQIIAEYGNDGEVAWVMRHFPILDLHPHSGAHAEAAECAAKLGGEESFWRFISALHGATPPGELFTPEGYGPLAKGLGLSETEFLSCTNGSEFDDRVARDFENGLVVGAKGTPFTIVSVKGMAPFAISGFIPYDGLKTIIERSISSAP